MTQDRLPPVDSTLPTVAHEVTGVRKVLVDQAAGDARIRLHADAVRLQRALADQQVRRAAGLQWPGPRDPGGWAELQARVDLALTLRWQTPALFRRPDAEDLAGSCRTVHLTECNPTGECWPGCPSEAAVAAALRRSFPASSSCAAAPLDASGVPFSVDTHAQSAQDSAEDTSDTD